MIRILLCNILVKNLHKCKEVGLAEFCFLELFYQINDVYVLLVDGYS